MSQVIKNRSTGPVPPDVPTSFIEQEGIAVPIANELIIDAFDSIENNVNGTITRGGAAAGDPPGTGVGNEVTIYLTNRISVTATTTDATPTTVLLMTPTDGTSVTFRVLITAYVVASNVATGGELLGLARKAGGTAVVVGTNDAFDESDAALAAADWDVVASGGTLLMQFTGIAATTIVWRALFEYTQSP